MLRWNFFSFPPHRKRHRYMRARRWWEINANGSRMYTRDRCLCGWISNRNQFWWHIKLRNLVFFFFAPVGSHFHLISDEPADSVTAHKITSLSLGWGSPLAVWCVKGICGSHGLFMVCLCFADTVDVCFIDSLPQHKSAHYIFIRKSS